VSFFDLLYSDGSLLFKGFGVAHGRLGKEFLKLATVVKGPLHVRYEFVGNVDREPSSLRSDVQDIAGVLFSLQTGLAVFANAGTPPKTERAQGGGPEICGLSPEPLFNVCG
jgi:hypothetical protein